MNHLFLKIIIVSGMVFSICQGQDGQKVVPSAKYNVHREYDKDGNLIHYDSTSVSTWEYGSSAKQDSVLRFPENNLQQSLSINDSINAEDSSYFGFIFPDLDMDLSFPDINSFLNNNHINNKDISRQLKDMEKRMDEMMNKNMELLKQFNEDHNNTVPGKEGTDSIMKLEKPKEMNRTKNTNIIKI